MRRQSRAQYHYAVRMIDRMNDRLRSEKMADHIVRNDSRSFWKEARRIRGNGNKMPHSVDNVSGDQEISEVFAKKFKHLFNSVGYDESVMNTIKARISKRVKESNCIDSCVISVKDLVDVIKCIDKGKSDGNLGLFSDHILQGSDRLYEYLSLLYNAMVIHGCSPSDMLVGTMIPIPKNRRLNISSSDNFRGICLQSVLCKILDLIILSKERKQMLTSDLQFGFKGGLSASMATAVVTETVDYYIAKGGSVYALALDATKAFDRVEYTKLFECLLDRGVNPLYTRLLCNMYLEQKIRVWFNQTYSEYFSVSNGVKQGGVLSPTLFSIYVDGMLTSLKDTGHGCHVGSNFIGCVSYADDLILLAPTKYSLKGMIHVCEDYAKQFSIVFNKSTYGVWWECLR